jgi:hypothetical protein
MTVGVVLANDTLIFTLWWIPVAVAFVVVIVAIGLLQNILVIARNIDTNVNDIWTVGKRIANNTVELWLLGRTVGLVKDIRVAAPQINEVAQTIAKHASECHHCPQCVSPDYHMARMSGGAATLTGRARAPEPAPSGSPGDTGPTSPRWASRETAQPSESGAGAEAVNPPWAWRSGEPGGEGGENKGENS